MKSIATPLNGILLMVLSSVMVCFGQYFLKLSTSQDGLFFLFIGFFMYVFSSLVMIKAYRFGKLSVLQPILCTSYIFNVLLSHYWLHEVISSSRLLGIFSIIVGVVLITGGDK